MGLVAIPGTCSRCGCTEDNACVDDDGEPCAWADAERTLCTVCEADETRCPVRCAGYRCVLSRDHEDDVHIDGFGSEWDGNGDLVHT